MISIYDIKQYFDNFSFTFIKFIRYKTHIILDYVCVFINTLFK
jgi:hypothetical protein